MKKIYSSKRLLEKKGFHIALYACVGLVIVAGGVYSYRNLSQLNAEQKLALEESAVDFNEMEMTNASNTLSYLAPEDRVESLLKNDNREDTDRELDSIVKNEEREDKESEDEKDLESSLKEENGQEQKDEKKDNSEESNNDTDELENVFEEVEYEEEYRPVFEEYTQSEKMSWPLEGDIVMNYSMDAPIYDETLDQYRTNDNIAISANLGEQVKATAEGVVKTVSSSREDGNYIVIDHGNGWETKYSQLQETQLVAEGDIVQAGQVIGGVSIPTIYEVLLGNHLDFSVTKDGEKIDPMTVLGG